MNKNIIIGVLAAVALVFGVLYFNTANLFGATGPSHYQQESFIQGLYAGTNRQLSISNAGLLTTSGGLTVSGILTATGDIRLKSPVITGASSTLSGTGTPTSTLTAAQACDNSLVTFSASTTAASRLILPTADTMFADCLTAIGDEATVYARNLAASTTMIAVGSASTTIVYTNATEGTSTIGAAGYAKITFVRAANNLMLAITDVFKP